MKKVAYIFGIFAVLSMSSCTAAELALANHLHVTVKTEATVEVAKDGDIDPPIGFPKP